MKTLKICLVFTLCFLALSPTVLAQKKKIDKKAIWFETPPAPLPFAWEGTYKGTLPCADCEGIQTIISLNKDNTFKILTKYIGKSDQVYKDDGRFLWKKEGNYIAMMNKSSSEDTSFALLSKDKLTLLDKNGKRIAGPSGPYYVMVKDVLSITGKYWKLIEMNGKSIGENKGGKEAYIYLTPEGNSFSGNGGCNTLMGSYELAPNNKVTFSGIASTMMACPEMEAEANFRLALESTDHFVIKGEFLILENAMKQAQAKFEVVQIR